MKTVRSPELLPAVILIAVAVAGPILNVYSSTSALTVFTSKSSYVVTEDIYVYGTLTYNGLPVQDWSVAVEAQDPIGTTVVTRTAQTDTNGEYNLTFRLPLQARTGTYTVYVASSYKGETATNATTFELMPRDVAVTNVGFYKNVLGQGFSVNITVTVENQGYPTETFNVTAYANTTAIATFTDITLTSGNSTTLDFTWNTTGFAKGNYTISAVADTVPGETDTADNNCTGGWVMVTWLGDLNGDFVVDEDDLWHFCGAFIDYYKIPSRLDANCDFSNDGKIDEDDLWTMCGAFIDYWKAH